jgi:hypothetical protein
MNYLFNSATGAPVQPVPVVSDANIIIEEILKRVPVAAVVPHKAHHPNISILHEAKTSATDHLLSTALGRTNHLRNCMFALASFMVLTFPCSYSLCRKAWPLATDTHADSLHLGDYVTQYDERGYKQFDTFVDYAQGRGPYTSKFITRTKAGGDTRAVLLDLEEYVTQHFERFDKQLDMLFAEALPKQSFVPLSSTFNLSKPDKWVREADFLGMHLPDLRLPPLTRKIFELFKPVFGYYLFLFEVILILWRTVSDDLDTLSRRLRDI